MKLNRGITLIALIITVIVLLILSGVAISLIINEGDLFEKSKEATESWNTAVAKEETGIKQLLKEIDEVSPTPVIVITEASNYPEKWRDDVDKLSGVATGGERTAPIPAGFVVSGIEGENTIGGGLVIYQTGNETITDDFWTQPDAEKEGLLNCQTHYNQFVWIPVDDINQMVMCKENTGENICNLVQQDDGSLKCMTHHADNDGTNLCGRLYKTDDTRYTTIDGKKKFQTDMNFNERDQIWEVTEENETVTYGFREPDLVSTYDKNSNVTTNSTGVANAAALGEKMENDFKTMAESVAKYGGFYVARYEAGYDSSSYTSVKGQEVMNAVSTAGKGANKWYGLYKHLSGTKGEVASIMIFGCQYDQIIRFIGVESQIGHFDRELASSSTDYRFSGTTPKDLMKNIYDLEGNYEEWTAEASSNGIRVGRGGCYNEIKSNKFHSASNRSGVPNPTYNYGFFSSRSALCM